VLGIWKLFGVNDAYRVGTDQREQPALERALVQLGRVPDAELGQRVEQRLQADALAVEQQLVFGREHPHLRQHPPLVGEQRGVDSGPGSHARDVV